jgi:hypothetical protein
MIVFGFKTLYFLVPEVLKIHLTTASLKMLANHVNFPESRLSNYKRVTERRWT